jgi:5-methylcytosine-specific restriction endonuclease McrA
LFFDPAGTVLARWNDRGRWSDVMAKRKGLSKRQRFEVFKRDCFTCQYCGHKPPAVTLEPDHVIAIANGGADHESNMVTACQDCNRGKSDVPLTSVPASLDEQRLSRLERVEQLREYNKFLVEVRQREDEEIDELGRTWHELIIGEKGRKYVFGQCRIPSIRTFLKSLPAIEVREAMEIALSRIGASFYSDAKAWKYFCGICWKWIKEGRH